jgi:hypothetical protein
MRLVSHPSAFLSPFLTETVIVILSITLLHLIRKFKFLSLNYQHRLTFVIIKDKETGFMDPAFCGLFIVMVWVLQLVIKLFNANLRDHLDRYTFLYLYFRYAVASIPKNILKPRQATSLINIFVLNFTPVGTLSDEIYRTYWLDIWSARIRDFLWCVSEGWVQICLYTVLISFLQSAPCAACCTLLPSGPGYTQGSRSFKFSGSLGSASGNFSSCSAFGSSE